MRRIGRRGVIGFPGPGILGSRRGADNRQQRGADRRCEKVRSCPNFTLGAESSVQRPGPNACPTQDAETRIEQDLGAKNSRKTTKKAQSIGIRGNDSKP